jgi:signal transduction histidine kinase
MEKVKIPSCIKDAVEMVHVPSTVQIQMKEVDTLPAVIAGRQSLAFVFRNLIENAIAAMHGNGSIFFQGSSTPAWVDVSITDSGPGIAPELHNQIFELHFSRAGAQPGKLGFGLWWVKTLMTRLGGSVIVESDGDHGTTFRLRLPSAESP